MVPSMCLFLPRIWKLERGSPAPFFPPSLLAASSSFTAVLGGVITSDFPLCSSLLVIVPYLRVPVICFVGCSLANVVEILPPSSSEERPQI